MIEQPLFDFLTNRKEGDEVIFLTASTFVLGKFVKYDRENNVVEIETSKINGFQEISNLTVLDRAILGWGIPTITHATAFGREQRASSPSQTREEV